MARAVRDMDIWHTAGPLEATINNLNRELQRKDVESKDLQRHWINLQTELVAKQNENSSLTEQQARLSSQFSILFQKKAGLQKSLESEQQEVNAWMSSDGAERCSEAPPLLMVQPRATVTVIYRCTIWRDK